MTYDVDLGIATYNSPSKTCIVDDHHYYDYCNDIKSIKSIEAQWYACYGNITDQIQFNLIKKREETKPANRETYIAIYHARILGFSHYFQVHFYKTAPDSSCDLRNLAESLNARGGVFSFQDIKNIDKLKEYLNISLQHIRVLAFQYYIMNSLNKNSACFPRDDHEIKTWVGNLFCEHAHNLVRMEWMNCNDNWFGYPTTEIFDQTPNWTRLKSVSNPTERGKIIIINEENPRIEALALCCGTDNESEQTKLQSVLIENYHWVDKQVMQRYREQKLLSEI